MTSSSLTKEQAASLVPRRRRLHSLALPLGNVLFIAATLVGGSLLAGCIADSAEDSDLPWASNKNWEGIAPIAPTMMDRYD